METAPRETFVQLWHDDFLASRGLGSEAFPALQERTAQYVAHTLQTMC